MGKDDDDDAAALSREGYRMQESLESQDGGVDVRSLRRRGSCVANVTRYRKGFPHHITSITPLKDLPLSSRLGHSFGIPPNANVDCRY